MKTVQNIIRLFSPHHSDSIGILEDNVDPTHETLSETEFEEKRAAERMAISVPVWYRVKSGWSKWFLGKSVDHSTTGIRLALPASVKPGTKISLKIKLPESEQPIDMKGIVVWVNPAPAGHDRETVECGVAFKDMRNIPNKEKLIYLIANKLVKVSLHFTKSIIAKPAATVEDLKACYRIVYRGYLPRRYCLPNEQRMHYNYYSLLPQSRTFTLKEKNNLIGTVSLVVDSPCGLPMEELFHREINHLRNSNRKLAEVCLLSMIQTDNKKKLFSLTSLDKQLRLFRLFKVMYEYAFRYAGVTDLIIGVHPKHETLYKYLEFKAMSSPKSYAGARGNPALPLHLDLLWAKENWSTYLKTFFLTEADTIETLKSGLVMDTSIARQFLSEDKKIWSKIPPKAQKYLKQCYPGIENTPGNFISRFIKK